MLAEFTLNTLLHLHRLSGFNNKQEVAELRQQLEKLDVQVRDGNAFDKRSVP